MTDDPDLSLSALFGTNGGKAPLDFLEVTKACFKPLEEPPDPGMTAVITHRPRPSCSPVTTTKNVLCLTMYNPHLLHD